MTTEQDRILDHELGAFFEAARTDASSAASPDLMSRILQDAYAAQDDLTAVTTPEPAPVTQGLWQGLAASVRALGGWPAMAGLVTATVAGVWIGYNPPLAVDATALPIVGSAYELSMDSSLPDLEFMLADG